MWGRRGHILSGEGREDLAPLCLLLNGNGRAENRRSDMLCKE